MKRIDLIMMLAPVLAGFGCEGYLDIRPSSKIGTPTTLEECQALLDDFNVMNTGYPSDGEAAADNYYLTASNWSALSSEEDRDTYVWAADGLHGHQQWLNPYRVVYRANLVIATLSKMDATAQADAAYRSVMGSALFFRAFAHLQVATLFADPYDPTTAGTTPGIPIRRSPNVTETSSRGTVEGTYGSIIEDLSHAAESLPEQSILPSRPNRAAAYAALSRVYLSMRDYARAGEMADRCLAIRHGLLDYNTLDTLANVPFARFGVEVLFHANTLSGGQFAVTRAMVDTSLLATYHPDDLRRKLFFRHNANGTANFKGGYHGAFNAMLFSGLAIDEVYLTRAECLARAGETAGAMRVLNALVGKRWKAGTYDELAASDGDGALGHILRERRKQLPFRTVRWVDLRRLNMESRHAAPLVRQLGAERHTLPPRDIRYTLLIPQQVIDNSTIEQNKR